MPRFLDMVGVLQPGDLPGVRHTTFVNTFSGYIDARLPRPVLGIELGLFPIDDLPAGDMRPQEAKWLAGTLNAAIEAGLSEFHAEFVPHRQR